MLNAYLAMCGHEVRTAEDGDAALRIAKRFSPDIIFMDIWMPRMDGLEACHRLRRDPMTRDVLIYALSAGASSEIDDTSCFDAFLTKPVELERLGEMVTNPTARRLSNSG